MIDEIKSISDIRKSQNLSQAELAEKVGVSQSTISRFEKGDLELSLQVLAKIARTLDVTVREIVSQETFYEFLGQQDQETFYAFCPNPFCDLNKLDNKDGTPHVYWKSGSKCAAWQFDEINYCSHCGTDLVKECSSCGRKFEERNTRFCVTCGNQITNRPTDKEWEEIRTLLKQREPADDMAW